MAVKKNIFIVSTFKNYVSASYIEVNLLKVKEQPVKELSAYTLKAQRHQAFPGLSY